MSKPVFEWLAVYLGLSAWLVVIAFDCLSKMALGALTSLLGAFFPSLRRQPEHLGRVRIQTGSRSLHAFGLFVEGGVRFLVVTGGVALMVSAAIDGHRRYIHHNPVLEGLPELSATPDDRLRSVVCSKTPDPLTPNLEPKNSLWNCS